MKSVIFSIFLLLSANVFAEGVGSIWLDATKPIMVDTIGSEKSYRILATVTNKGTLAMSHISQVHMIEGAIASINIKVGDTLSIPQKTCIDALLNGGTRLSRIMLDVGVNDDYTLNNISGGVIYGGVEIKGKMYSLTVSPKSFHRCILLK